MNGKMQSPGVDDFKIPGVKPLRKKWFRVRDGDQTDATLRVKQLAELLSISETVWEGPLTGGLNTDTLELYREQRLRRDFLSKYPGFSWGNPREAAIAAFWKSESECAEANERLYWHSRRSTGDPLYPAIDDPTLRAARSFIRRVLGKFSWSLVLERGRFGPGVTSSAKGGKVHSAEKYGSKPEVSPSFAKMGMKLVSSLPSWSCLLTGIDYPAWVTPLPIIVPGNRTTFVPKNAKTDRGIAVEPHVNIWFQLGIGTLLRERLKKAGLDLDTQEVNQELARLGSIDDTLSTIDLERASDTLPYRLVEMLLPEDWFAALNMTRSQFGKFPDGAWRPYEKFSSMGNGFTFELESLIFWALSSSVAQLNGYNPFWCTSYGDDIVVPSGIYDDVVKVLSWCGFTVNLAKSYSHGPFRESCGKDYLRGSLVRPVFLKEIPLCFLDWIKIANNLKRLAHQWADFKGLDSRLRPAYEFAVSLIPREISRLSVSDGYGDVALIRDFDQARPAKAGAGWEGYATNVLLSRPITYESKDRKLVTSGVSNLGRNGNSLPFRDSVEHTIGTMYIAEWRNMGSWI